MIRQWSTTKKIASEALDDFALTGDRYFDLFDRWGEEAVSELGHYPYYGVKSVEADIDCGIIQKPEDFISPRAVYLCTGKDIIEAQIDSAAPQGLFNPDGCCTLYRKNGYQSHPRGDRYGAGGSVASTVVALGENRSHYFFTVGDPDLYDFAIIEYNGHHYEEDGGLMVLQKAQLGVKSFIRFKWLDRLSFQDKTKVTDAQLVRAEMKMDKDMAKAYGRMHLTPRPVMKEWALRAWGNRFPAPYTRVNN